MRGYTLALNHHSGRGTWDLLSDKHQQRFLTIHGDLLLPDDISLILGSAYWLTNPFHHLFTHRIGYSLTYVTRTISGYIASESRSIDVATQ